MSTPLFNKCYFCMISMAMTMIKDVVATAVTPNTNHFSSVCLNGCFAITDVVYVARSFILIPARFNILWISSGEFIFVIFYIYNQLIWPTIPNPQ